MLRFILITVFLLLFINIGLVQVRGQSIESSNMDEDVDSDDDFEGIYIFGKVLDSLTKVPLQYGTVKVLDSTNVFIAGALIDSLGYFEIELESSQHFTTLQINYIGYKSKNISKFIIITGEVEVGTVALIPDKDLLNTVEVTGEASQLIFKLDKKIFQVGSDLTNSGASTLDILGNVPSVSIGMKGEITLRGNDNVKIYINGNPVASTSNGKSALKGITGDMIESIEVITNPGAKYDAEGTAGILNIILKKEIEGGFNGGINITAGLPNSLGLGFSLNYRTDKLNISGGINAGYSTFLETDYSVIKDSTSSSPLYIISKGKGHNKGFSGSANFGADYTPTDKDFLTLSGSYDLEKTTRLFTYDISNQVNSDNHELKRTETGTSNSPGYEYNVLYSRQFKTKDQKLIFNHYGFAYGENKNSTYQNSSTTQVNDLRQKVNTRFTEQTNGTRLDYNHEFKNKSVFEIGTKYSSRNLKNNYSVEKWISNNWVINNQLSNDFGLKENIFAGYMTFAKDIKKFSFKLGFRGELTDLTTTLENTNQSYNQNYFNLFPSAHTSYKFTKTFSTQLSYSKRISRPDMFYLNPFESLGDNFSQYKGNPKLSPEYTNAFELGMIKRLSKGTFSGSVFNRYTSNTIEEAQVVENQKYITTPLSIGNRMDLGVEVNQSFKATKWLSFLADFNWTYYKRTGGYKGEDFNFSSQQWQAGLTSKMALPKKIKAQVSLKYRSDQKQLLTTINQNFYVNAGIRKKILKGRGALSFSVRDIFNSNQWKTTTNQLKFYRYQNLQWGGRQFYLGLNIQFGGGDEGFEEDDYDDEF